MTQTAPLHASRPAPALPESASSPADEPATVSAALRASTATAHERAENSNFITELMSGNLDLTSWSRFLEQLEAIYAALEEVRPTIPADAHIAPLMDERLDRAEAIRRDLAKVQAETGAAPIGVLPSTAAYAERIRQTAGDPVRYLAHHYTRYLGDLSGGRIIKVKLDQHYDLAADSAAFFDFGNLQPVPFKRAYRATLDEWNLGADGLRQLTEEASASFAANEAVFAELMQYERVDVAA